MLNNLKWMSIAQRLQFNTIRFIRKLKHGEVPKYRCNQIRYVGDSQPYPKGEVNTNAENAILQGSTAI